MTRLTPIAVGEKNAAKLMDMSLERFQNLVESGSLPRPKPIAPGVERWSVAELDAILNGTKMDDEEITW
ncbi:hypothetical protein [Ruegeria sp. HKCCA4812]|uniref:hypothetical protein n=1 Tax=Ruegeria sp. HKCCA4812 TaxID=2682993 RepID=UPI001488149E|nr:hypothetical protein [Ruegeria sp. HKCCA4812]